MGSQWWVEERGKPAGEKTRAIADIKREVGIRDVLSYYGAVLPVYRSIGWSAIRCPFHADNTPSASYNEQLDRFNCHTCDEGGDIFDVVQWQEALDLKEAIKWVSDHWT